MAAEQPSFCADASISSQTVDSVREHFATEDELTEFLVADKKLTDLEGIGNKTAGRLRSWFENEHQELEQKRREQSDAYCRAFVADVAVPDDDDKFYFGFVCPKCEQTNNLVGDPAEFAGRPYACVACGWTPLLDSDVLNKFRADNYPSSTEDDT